MGLRFRKTMTIAPGVRLNFGLTGMSVSAGVPGFRKTYHTSGRTTTTVGIPGTGLYYVDTQNRNGNTSMPRTNRGYSANDSFYGQAPTDNSQENAHTFTEEIHIENPVSENLQSQAAVINETEAPLLDRNVRQVSLDEISKIHKSADDTIDWTLVLAYEKAPEAQYNSDMWSYYHSIAPQILSGDIDSYLKLIYEVNPLDDLLDYGTSFQFGTDDPRKIEVEFSVEETALRDLKQFMSPIEYNDAFQDFVCSMCIRIARDMFALLPIKMVAVHADLKSNTIVSVKFERSELARIKFGYIDSSDTIERFEHRMEYTTSNGFEAVERLQ